MLSMPFALSVLHQLLDRSRQIGQLFLVLVYECFHTSNNDPKSDGWGDEATKNFF